MMQNEKTWLLLIKDDGRLQDLADFGFDACKKEQR